MHQDLVLTTQVKAGDSLQCNDHEIAEFRILYGRDKAISGVATVDFRRANFDLFRDRLGGILLVRALEGKGGQIVDFLELLPSSRAVHS